MTAPGGLPDDVLAKLARLVTAKREQDEHELRRTELALRQLEMQQSAAYANRVLDIRATEAGVLREVADKNGQRGVVVILAVLAAALVFSLAAMYMGKEAMLLELVKLLVYGAGGGSVGWFLGRSSSKKREE